MEEMAALEAGLKILPMVSIKEEAGVQVLAIQAERLAAWVGQMEVEAVEVELRQPL
jgi:hypothetical protein